jgi:hypothetical protein
VLEENKKLSATKNGGSVLFNLAKGAIYGAVIGLFFALAIFLLATAVAGLGFLTVSPTLLAGVIFAAGFISGIAKEYADWLDQQ